MANLTRLKQLNPMDSLNKLPSLAQLEPLKSYKKGSNQESFFADYNNPTEINSFADAIFNAEAKRQADWGIFNGLKEIPVLNTLPAVVDLIYNKGIKPILHGDFKAAGVNTLINLGETLDIVANPVKGVILDKDPLTGLVNGLGLGKNGRINYDYNTGNWVTDIGLEVITDPINWVTFGAKGLLSSGVKASVKEVTEELSTKLVKDIAQKITVQSGKEVATESAELLFKNMSRKIYKNTMDILTDTVTEQAQKQVTRWVKAGVNKSEKLLLEEATETIINKQRAELVRVVMQNIQKTYPVLKDEMYSTLLQQTEAQVTRELLDLSYDSLTNRVTKSLAQVYNTTESFNKALMKSAFMTSGLGLSWKAVTPLTQHAGKFINARLISRMKSAKFIDANNVLDIFRYDDAKNSFLNNVKMLKSIDGEDYLVHNTDTYLKYVTRQLREDTVQLATLHNLNLKNVGENIATLNKYVELRYPGKSLQEYIDNITYINNLEGGIFQQEVDTLKRIQARFKNSTTRTLLNMKPITIKQVYTDDVIKNALKNLQNTVTGLQKINALQDLSTNVDRTKIKFFADSTFNVLKADDFAVQLSLLDIPALQNTLTSINSKAEGGIGILLDNILSDPKAIGSDIYTLAKRLKTVSESTMSYQEFVTDVLNATYTPIKGVTDKDLKMSILNVLYSFKDKTATSFIDQVDVLSAELFNLAEESLNSRRIGQAPVFIPLETKIVFKEQLKRYAETVIAKDATANILYPLAEDYTTVLSKTLYALEKGYGVQAEFLEAYRSIKEVGNALNSVKNFNNMQYVYNKTILQDTAAKQAFRDVTGHPTVIQALQADLDGAFYLSEKKFVNTERLMNLFDLTEGAEYSVNFLQRAEDFSKRIQHNLSRYVYTDTIKNIDDALYTEYYETALRYMQETILQHADEVSDTSFLEVIAKLNPSNAVFTNDYTDPLFSAYATIQAIRNWAQTQPIASRFDEMFSYNPNNLANVLHARAGYAAKVALGSDKAENWLKVQNILKHPKLLEKAVTVYNPQNVIKSLLKQQFSDMYDGALKSYTKIRDVVSNNTENLRTLNKVLALQEEGHNMLTLTQRYVNALDDVDKNIFKYVQDTVNRLYDVNSVDKIRQAFMENAPRTGSAYLQYRDTVLKNLEQFLDVYAEPISNEAFEELRIVGNHINVDLNAPYAKIMEYNKGIEYATDTHLRKSTLDFLTLSPEDMQKELIFRGRMVFFNTDDWATDKTVQRVYKDLLMYQQDAYKAKGIHFIKTTDGANKYVAILDKSVTGSVTNGVGYLNKERILRPLLKNDYSEFKRLDPKLYDALTRYQEHLEMLTGNTPNTSIGDIMDDNLIKLMYNGYTPEQIKELNQEMIRLGKDPIQYHTGLPDEAKKLLPALDELIADKNINQYMFNESVLGSASTRRGIQQYFSGNIIKNLKNNMEQVSVYLDTKTEFINSIAGSQFSINKGIYSNFSNQDLLQALQSTDRFKLVSIVEDAKYVAKIKEILPISEDSIIQAKKLNAVVVPKGLYTTLINKVNHRLGSTGFFKYWNRIMYLYKFGYLMNIGTVARNYADTNLKTSLTLGKEAIDFKTQARQLIKEYAEASIEIAKRHPNKSLTAKGVQNFFEEIGTTKAYKINAEMFNTLTDFFMYGPVDNITESSLQQLKLTDLDFIGKDNWRTFTHYSSQLMSWANQTEDTNRLALYLESIASGATKHGAWERISKVHFDYKFKTPTEQLLESVFPFSTFAIRNTNYWVETMLNNPHYAVLFRDIMTPIWDLDHHTKKEIEQSWSLQYQLINGNISLFNNKDIDYVLRINPSIMDSINILTNPVQAVRNRVAQPLQNVKDIITGRTTPSTEMLPIIGTLQQRFDKLNTEQNVLPALITKRDTTKNTRKFNTNFKNKNLLNYTTMNSFINPQFSIPRVRTDVRIDPYRTIGVKAFTTRLLPNPNPKVYNKVLYGHKTDVYAGIRYSMKLNFGYFR